MKAVTGYVQKSYLYCAQNLKLHPPVQQANIKNVEYLKMFCD